MIFQRISTGTIDLYCPIKSSCYAQLWSIKFGRFVKNNRTFHKSEKVWPGLLREEVTL